MTPREVHEFNRLVSDYLDGVLAPEEFEALEQLVRDNPECRQRYLELAALHGSLGWELADTTWHDAEFRERDAGRRATLRRRRAVAGVGLAVVVVAWLAARPGPPTPDGPAAPFAHVVEVGGRAEVAAGGRDGAEAGEGTPVFPGQTVRTDGADGFAVLDLGGGARLELGPDAQLRVAEVGAGGRRLILTSGLLRGVVGDLTGVTVHTSQAEVSLRVARFLVSAAPDVTEVEAESGSVRLVRAADGQSLDVPAGSAVVVSAAEPMELRRAAHTARPRAEFKVSAHWGLAFQPDGRTLFAGLKGTGWTRIDLATGRTESIQPPVGEPTPAAALSADAGTYALVTKGGRVRVFAPQTGAERGGFDVAAPTGGFWAASADGTRIVFARPVPGPGDKVRVWELPSGRELTPTAADTPPRCMAVSADGRLVAWAAEGTRKRPGHTLTVWDVAAARVVATIPVPDRPLHQVVFTPDGRRLAGGTDHGAVHVWQADSGRWVAGRGASDGWARPVRALAFAPDGRLLAAGLSDGCVRLWTVGAADDTPLECGRAPVTALAFAPDGRTLAAGTNRGSTTLWDILAPAD